MLDKCRRLQLELVYPADGIRSSLSRGLGDVGSGARACRRRKRRSVSGPCTQAERPVRTRMPLVMPQLACEQA